MSTSSPDPASAPRPPIERPAPERPASARLAAERLDYLSGSLADDAPADPLALFDTWMEEAFARRDTHGDLSDPSAAVLSTVARGADGQPQPRSRTVLLKGRDERGVLVYTNLCSDKAREIEQVPRAALLLPWYPLQRQLRLEGHVETVDDATSDAYWAQRPRGSQLGAWSSEQSRPITSRAQLEERYARAEERFEGQDVPRPTFWGGLRLVPSALEFWQGRAHRVHDRIAYRRDGEGPWRRERLQP